MNPLEAVSYATGYQGRLATYHLVVCVSECGWNDSSPLHDTPTFQGTRRNLGFGRQGNPSYCGW